MNNYLRVDSDTSLVRDINSNAIISKDKNEYDKFLEISESKYKEKKRLDDMKSDLDSLKSDIEEIKMLLKNIVHN